MISPQLTSRLFMVGFEGIRFTQELEQFLEKYSPAGFILFSRNIRDPVQLCKLIEDIQVYVSNRYNYLPLFGIDQEGGTVARLRSPLFFSLPGAMAFGLDRSGDLANRAGAFTGQQLAAIGINIDFAPVVDLNTNPFNPQLGLRSFGDNPEHVGMQAGSFARGLIEHGVLPTAKHFPGLGDCSIDSHDSLPVIYKSVEEIINRELVPFKLLIDAGIPLVMTAHVCFPDVEKDLPVTLTPVFMKKLLREHLQFDGVIITDDLMMGGITTVMDTPQAAVKTLQAGADLCLICNSLETAAESMNLVAEKYRTGEIDAHSVQQAAARVTRLQEKTELSTPACLPSREEGERLSREIARCAVTIEGNAGMDSNGRAPGQTCIIFPELKDFCPVSEGMVEETGIAGLFPGRTEITTVRIPVDTASENYGWLRDINGYDNVIVISYDAFRHDGQQIVHQKLVDSGASFTQIIAGNPVDEQILPAADCRIKTYGSHINLIERAFQLLHIL